MNLKSHWDKAYLARDIKDLGWYEEFSSPSLDLINKCELDKSSRILNVGAGSSTLTDSLINLGFLNIIATDISEIALKQLEIRLKEHSDEVTYIIDDLSKPYNLLKLEQVDLWHDRAVLHFLTKNEEQEAYFQLLKKLVKKGGYAILAEFELEHGAEKCCNLDVFRYDAEMLSQRLGSEFELVESFSHDYKNPRGENRPYIYTLFKRIS